MRPSPLVCPLFCLFSPFFAPFCTFLLLFALFANFCLFFAVSPGLGGAEEMRFLILFICTCFPPEKMLITKLNYSFWPGRQGRKGLCREKDFPRFILFPGHFPPGGRMRSYYIGNLEDLLGTLNIFQIKRKTQSQDGQE